MLQIGRWKLFDKNRSSRLVNRITDSVEENDLRRCFYFVIITALLRNNITGGFVYYVFDDEPMSVGLDETDASRLTFAYVSLGEVQSAASYFSLPENTVSRISCADGFSQEVWAYDDCIFAILSLGSMQLAVFVRKNLFLVVPVSDELHEIRDICILPSRIEDASLEKLIYIFFDRLITSQSKCVSTLRRNIDAMEKQLLSKTDMRDFNLELFKLKQDLSELYNGYDRLLDLLSLFVNDEEGSLEINDAGRIGQLCERAGRLKDSVKMLCDSVVHLRDAYQSSIDLRLNQIMKIFTVFTVIFSPLSFITGWYGMNFKYMPELSSRFGYIGVGIVVVCVAAVLLAWFKHKRWI